MSNIMIPFNNQPIRNDLVTGTAGGSSYTLQAGEYYHVTVHSRNGAYFTYSGDASKKLASSERSQILDGASNVVTGFEGTDFSSSDRYDEIFFTLGTHGDGREYEITNSRFIHTTAKGATGEPTTALSTTTDPATPMDNEVTFLTYPVYNGESSLGSTPTDNEYRQWKPFKHPVEVGKKYPGGTKVYAVIRDNRNSSPTSYAHWYLTAQVVTKETNTITQEFWFSGSGTLNFYNDTHGEITASVSAFNKQS